MPAAVKPCDPKPADRYARQQPKRKTPQMIRSHIRAFQQKQRFDDLALDQWRADSGSLDESRTSDLRRRQRVFRWWRLMKTVARLPTTTIRVIQNSFLTMLDLDRLHGSPRRQISQGKGCVLDRLTWLLNGSNIELGDFVKVSAFSTLIAGREAKIKIGNYAILGPGVVVVAANHGAELDGVPIRYQPWREKTVDIGPDVWIGANAIVLPGTIIGSGSVIGAGTVVSGNIPSNVIVYQERESLVMKQRVR